MSKVIAVTLATAGFLASAWSFQKPAPVDPWNAADVISADEFAKDRAAHGTLSCFMSASRSYIETRTSRVLSMQGQEQKPKASPN